MQARPPLWFVMFALAAACAVPADDTLSMAPLPDDAVFEETVVELTGDTARVVSTRPLTVGDARRDNATRDALEPGSEAARIWNDGGCSGISLWLYDRADWTGNRICFRGAGTAYLGSYWRFADGYWQTWAIGIGAVWPGTASGRLVGNSYSDIDADPPVPLYHQVWEFPAYGSRHAFYGLIVYDWLTLDS